MEITSYLKKQMQKRMYFLDYKKVNWYLIDEREDCFTYLNHAGETLQYFNHQYVYTADKFTADNAVQTIENWQYEMYVKTHLADFR